MLARAAEALSIELMTMMSSQSDSGMVHNYAVASPTGLDDKE